MLLVPEFLDLIFLLPRPKTSAIYIFNSTSRSRPLNKMPQKIVRTVCFSHSEPFLEFEGRKYQVMTRIFEIFKGGEKPFELEIQFWNQTDGKFSKKDFLAPSLETALEHSNKVFWNLGFDGIPEVLYLPEWSDSEVAQGYIKKWSDNLFGLGNSGLQVPAGIV